MKEIACQFGENNRLCGIMTRPEHVTSDQVLVFISPGFEAKHGPYRLHKHVARMAAEHGIGSFRFDFGDLGYSQPAQSRKLLHERKNDEIKVALDYIQSTFKIDKFVLMGLCSAAEDAFRYADLDQRIKGIIMIDTFAYETPRNPVFNFFNRLQRWSLRKIRPIRSYLTLPSYDDSNDVQLVNYRCMKKTESESILVNLLKREIRLHFIYTDGNGNHQFTHKSQLWKMFPGLKDYPYVALDFFPTMGHAPLLEEERECLIKAIRKRLLKMYRTIDC